MIERLRRALEHIEELSPEAQQDLAQQIEDYTEPPDNPFAVGSPDESLPDSVRAALALGGAWSDLSDDDEIAALDRLRHEAPPAPPLDEQLAWLDDDATTS